MLRFGFECHNLEQTRAGVARSLTEMFPVIARMHDSTPAKEIFLYFKGRIPDDAIMRHPIFHPRVLPSPIGRPSFLFFYTVSLPRALARDKISAAFFPSYMLPFRVKTPAAVAMHDIAYEAHPEWFHPVKRRHQYRIFSRHAARRSQRIITISQFSKNEIMRYYQVPPEKITVAHLGVNPKFSPERNFTTEDVIRKKYNLTGDFIVWVGQMLARRHVPEAIRGFAELAKRMPSLQFLVSGPNWIYPPIDIERLIRRVNEELRRRAVIRVPFVPDDEVVHLYRASKFLVYLSSYEGMGLPLLEALACGTPIVTMRFGASAELFGDAAFFVEDPEDATHVATVFDRALTDEAERTRIRAVGIEIPRTFTWERYTNGVLTVLKEVSRL
ncbi:MAG: glycosyltransferase family 4 protein [Parcubacteria group bacterium]|nr:glycosyltransferase family 4 protein [Parcubacteria group bacterium]